MGNNSYKFRIYPTRTQQRKLGKVFGCARFVWNQFVDGFNKHEKPLKISELRAKHEFLKDVSSCAMGEVRRNFRETVNQFFNKKRKAQLGRPKFKKRGKSRGEVSQPIEAFNTNKEGRV